MKQFSYVLTHGNAHRSKSISSLLKEASHFASRVRVSEGDVEIPLEALRAMQTLELECGNRITVTIEGKDEEAAVAAIQNYFVENM